MLREEHLPRYRGISLLHELVFNRCVRRYRELCEQSEDPPRGLILRVRLCVIWYCFAFGRVPPSDSQEDQFSFIRAWRIIVAVRVL